jgi:hypothetical protein
MPSTKAGWLSWKSRQKSLRLPPAPESSLEPSPRVEFFDLLTDFEKGLILLDDFDHRKLPEANPGAKKPPTS